MKAQHVAGSLFLALALAYEQPGIHFNKTLHKEGFCFTDLEAIKHLYQPNWISFPVDHFHNESRYAPHSNKTFRNRFWVDDTFYRPGGPVIVENTGESSGAYSSTGFEVGLIYQLAKATNGLAVRLEHRYFGQSIPVPTIDPEAFRFLSTEQAMADQAFFAQNVVFPGKEHLNLTSPNTPWFAIGCSYPGGLTAFERIQYPDLFWGALSSSGVTAPKTDLWEYYNAVRKFSPPECALRFGKVINIVDNILYSGNITQINQLKTFFKISTNTSDAQFASTFEYGVYLQAENWLPCYQAAPGAGFCPVILAPTILHPNKTEKYKSTAQEIIANGGWANESESLTATFLNYMADEDIAPFVPSTPSDANPRSTDPFTYGGSLRAIRGWNYLRCSEWGYWQTGDGPPATLPIIPRLLTFRYLSGGCRRHFHRPSISEPSIPDSAGIDRYGRYNVSYPRLMLVGGERDPWRPSTPLASREGGSRLDYPSTPDQPYHIIPGATHCWDWFGVSKVQENATIPPESIKIVHALERDTFKRWLKEWHDAHPNYDVYAR